MCCIGEECARALKCNHLKVEIVRKSANKECSTTVEPEDWTKTTKSIETKFCSLHTRDALTMRNLFDLDSIFTWRTAFPWKWPKLIELIRQCFPSMAHPSYRKCESTYLQMLFLRWMKKKCSGNFCANNLNHINHHDWYGMICKMKRTIIYRKRHIYMQNFFEISFSSVKRTISMLGPTHFECQQIWLFFFCYTSVWLGNLPAVSMR